MLELSKVNERPLNKQELVSRIEVGFSLNLSIVLLYT